MIIYTATNMINNKIYVGKSKGRGGTNEASLNRRKRQHKHTALTKKSQTFFAKAIRKYGWESFVWGVIDTGTSNDELIEKEKYWVRYYQSNNEKFGYNLTEGGDGIDGYKFSEELKKKLSDAHKGVKLSEEHRRRIGESNKGRVVTEETRQKIRDKQLGVPRKTAGEKHPLAKLTESNVKQIKQMLMRGKPKREIAKEFGVTRNVITFIQQGQTWVNVEVEGFKPFSIDVLGENNVNAKLTKNQVIEIKRLFIQGEKTDKEISKLYGVSLSTINRIHLGKLWNHVELDGFVPKIPKKLKLTHQEFREIMKLLDEGESYRKIASKYSTCVKTVSKIAKGETYQEFTHSYPHKSKKVML
ncbi:group I intron endonuclease [Peribacillus sp. B2I2]|uniref:NUMOD3 domain-containing DNA-binding protein n=1 Tax=Peribacillus sp. B2I2 TaxID=3156468 RepID=UPI003510F334